MHLGKSSPTAKTAKTTSADGDAETPDPLGDQEKEDQSLQNLQNIQNLIEESDTIIKELNKLLPTSRGPMSALFGSVLKSGLEILKRKRGSGNQKQRDPNEIYRELNPKVQRVERDLRETLASITERKSALQDQARLLMSRLDACILYNVERTQLADAFIKDCQKMHSSLNDEFAKVVQMLEFNRELMAQNGSQGTKNFSAWTYVLHKMKDRTNSFSGSPDTSSNGGDSDEIFLRYKHEKCEKCIEEYEMSLSQAQEVKSSHVHKLENCSEMRLQLISIIRENESPGSPDSRLSSPHSLIHTQGDDFLDEPNNDNFYDHSNCHDCLNTYNISTNCAESLKKLDKQEESISERLLTLIELREGLKGILEQQSLLQTKDASLFISSLPISIPSGRVGEELELPVKQLQRDVERDVIVINGKKILGSVGIENVINEIVFAIGEVFGQNSFRTLYKEPTLEAKKDFAMAILRRAARTNRGGNSFEALQSLVDLMEIEIQPQSSLASPLEVEISIGSCAKYMLDSSSDEIQQFSDVDVVGLMAKIQTSTNYLLMKSQEKVKARTLSFDTGISSVKSDVVYKNNGGEKSRNLFTTGERSSTSAVDGAITDATLAVASMTLEGKIDDKMETTEDEAIDKFCDLTAIYENQVFVALSKNEDGKSPAKRKWFSPLRSKIIGSPKVPQQAPIRTGYGNVLIDQRR